MLIIHFLFCLVSLKRWVFKQIYRNCVLEEIFKNGYLGHWLRYWSSDMGKLMMFLELFAGLTKGQSKELL